MGFINIDLLVVISFSCLAFFHLKKQTNLLFWETLLLSIDPQSFVWCNWCSVVPSDLCLLHSLIFVLGVIFVGSREQLCNSVALPVL